MTPGQNYFYAHPFITHVILVTVAIYQDLNTVFSLFVCINES